MNRLTFVLLLIVAVSGPDAIAESAAKPLSAVDSIAQVWQQEEAYWRYVKTGDADAYETLWHDKFIGWPCGQEHPLRKASIGNWVREIREKRIRVAIDLTREGAEDFGDVVVVHYRFTRVDTHPDGTIEGQGKLSKITHTWMRQGSSWVIVGGMCGGLPDSAK